jgi:hypothetical protein
MLLLEDPLAEPVDLRDPDEFGLAGAGFRPVPSQVVTRNNLLNTSRAPIAAELKIF